MFNFPPATSPVCELFDKAHVAAILQDPALVAKLPTMAEARTKARAFLDAEPIAVGVNYLVNHVDQVMLVQFFQDGRPRYVHWNFTARA